MIRSRLDWSASIAVRDYRYDAMLGIYLFRYSYRYRWRYRCVLHYNIF